jgi:NTE family protein
MNNRLIVDGSVTNNYPINEVRKLETDIIIGVDVQDDLLKRKSLKDTTKILVQINNLNSIQKMKENIKRIFMSKPDISDYGVISFERGKKL